MKRQKPIKRTDKRLIIIKNVLAYHSNLKNKIDYMPTSILINYVHNLDREELNGL